MHKLPSLVSSKLGLKSVKNTFNKLSHSNIIFLEKQRDFQEMAKITIRVDARTGVTYFPKEIRQEGFVGEIQGLPNALTFTLIKPGTTLADVERSLMILLEDIRLRREQGQK